MMYVCYKLKFTFFYRISGEPSQNGSSAHTSQNGGLNASHTVVNQSMSVLPISASGTPGAVAGPATNLNIGMDYWGTPTSSNIPAIRGKVPSTTIAGGVVTGGSRDSVQSQLWLQVNLENRPMMFILLP
jgi:plant G-box-binding factor